MHHCTTLPNRDTRRGEKSYSRRNPNTLHPMPHQRIILSASLALAALVASCSTSKGYDGPERPIDQLATLWLPTSARIKSIDGKIVQRDSDIGPDRKYVLPGTHELLITRVTASDAVRVYYADYRLSCTFQANGTYMFWIDEGRLRIVDVGTGYRPPAMPFYHDDAYSSEVARLKEAGSPFKCKPA